MNVSSCYNKAQNTGYKEVEAEMRIVIAPQSLKGSLSALRTGEAIAEGTRGVFPEAEIELVPIADGGEETVQALVDATGGKIVLQQVTGPLGEPVQAFYGLLGDGRTAVIEMAASSGLPLVPSALRDPRISTTYGVGELILAALDQGRRHFIIGIGGSATNDGGAGMAQALGADLLDEQGRQLPSGGAALVHLNRISIERLDPRLRECSFQVACDVNNPLCGPQGASAIYGPQKGATPGMVDLLDQALGHYSEMLRRDLGMEVAAVPGSGAAGGLGAGMLAFLRALMRPGAEIVLEAVQMERRLTGADLLITAEGQLDAQTAYGKSVGSVAQLAKRYGIPVLVVAGSLGKRYQQAYRLGIDGITVLPDGPISLASSMEQAYQLTRDAIERALSIYKMGRNRTSL